MGIAQTERLVLVIFGTVTAFAGFVVLLVGRLPGALRLGIGIPVVVIGALLTALAVRVQSGTAAKDIAPQTLQFSERFVLSCLAVVAFVGAGLLLVARPIPLGIRLPLLLMTLVLAGGFSTAAVANRLPERTPPPVRQLHNTDD